jgi:hypothetical protein
LGLIEGDRRLRLVQLFNKDSQLAQLTLIREKLADTEAPERPPLTLEQLLGEWQGEAVTIYPDWRSPDIYPTRLEIQHEESDYAKAAPKAMIPKGHRQAIALYNSSRLAPGRQLAPSVLRLE